MYYSLFTGISAKQIIRKTGTEHNTVHEIAKMKNIKTSTLYFWTTEMAMKDFFNLTFLKMKKD